MLAILALILLVSNVLPTGWMPDREPDGTLVVRICSQGLTEALRIRFEALAQARADHAMHGADEQSGDENQAASDPCPYGVVANAFAVPPASPPMAEPVEAIEADLLLLASNVDIGTGLSAPL
ncbi:hypothetical protein QQS45_02855 [Alteriqipengyuania flavescens]|uniref:DUF2946 family protein n=1 Tax=Alteriqipengyuania flavescens TaxID=3053610 RepID=UPI0025B4692D|nr:DUF2946 family protein [Alteriqipengyuania flavescens]WJY19190.1 hypothetical protein QQW98_02850 [Alteriqipengyuania flavescens]WJY25130.1 hypothetical protein QQS45_02855 [Alteriqipengyuania flavescens]